MTDSLILGLPYYLVSSLVLIRSALAAIASLSCALLVAPIARERQVQKLGCGEHGEQGNGSETQDV